MKSNRMRKAKVIYSELQGSQPPSHVFWQKLKGVRGEGKLYNKKKEKASDVPPLGVVELGKQ